MHKETGERSRSGSTAMDQVDVRFNVHQRMSRQLRRTKNLVQWSGSKRRGGSP